MAGLRRVLTLFFNIVLICLIHESKEQAAAAAADKRKASENFCMSQCSGLLNPGSQGVPDKSVCNEPSVFCANPKFSNAYICCKDYPVDLFKNNQDTIYPKCKDRGFPNAPPTRLLQSYVINTATGSNGKIDIELLTRVWGKQMCYIDCAFQEYKLVNADGSLNIGATKDALSGTSPYKYLINSVIDSCSNNIKTNYGPLSPKMKLTYDPIARECNPLPLLMHQCIRRIILTEPCAGGHSAASNSTVDCDPIVDIKKCDPFNKAS